MGKQNNQQPKNLYQMSIAKSRAIDMVDALSRTYVKDSTIAHMDSFITSYFKQLDDLKIPWLDIPFYINSLNASNFPKELRETFGKRGLVGKMSLSEEERAKQSIEYFVKNKHNIIRRYTDYLVIYLCTRRLNIKMLSLQTAAELFDLSRGQMQELLNSKNIPLYDILGEIRVKESDLAILLNTCRVKQSDVLHSDVTFDGKQEAKAGNVAGRKESPPQSQTRPQNQSQTQPRSQNQTFTKSPEDSPRKTPQSFVPDKGTNFAEDDVKVGLFQQQNVGEENCDVATEAVSPTECETDNVSNGETAQEQPATTATAPTNVTSDADDPLNLFESHPLPPADEDTTEEFETGDNTFPDETGEPPTEASYRNRE